MEGIWAVARARLRRRWLGLVALGVLAGVVGGTATAAVAGERRTVTVAPRLIEATRAHDALITVNALDPDPAVNDADAARIRAAIEAQPGVRAVWPIGSFIGRTTTSKDWYYPIAGLERDPRIYRPILAAGRLADPSATDEIVLTAQTAANTHLGVGSVVSMDFYAPSQFLDVVQGSEVRPSGAQDVRLRVVGLLRDAFDIAPAATARFMLATPAFARRWGPVLVKQQGFAVKLDQGTAGVRPFVTRLTDRLGPTAVQVRTNVEALRTNESADRVARLSILVLGAVIALLGLFAVGQATRRHLTLDEDESRTLEALGFRRRDRILAATIPGLLTAAVSIGVAVTVTYLLSPVFPLGRPRRLEPTPGFELNALVGWTGALLTALAVAGTFVLAAAIGRGRHRPPPRRPLPGLRALTTTAPPSVVLGTRLALEPSSGRTAIGARSAVLGTAVGVVGAVAALTFAGSFRHLVSSAPNWGADYHLSIEVPSDRIAAESRATATPQQGITERSREIARGRDVAAVALQSSATVEIGGEATPVVALDRVKGRIQPVLRSGRAPVGDDEIALGPALARRLGVEPGDRVQVGPRGSRRSMVVVGTVLDSSSVTADYAEGALMSDARLRAVTRNQPELDYYQVILVRFSPEADVPAATAALDRRYPWGIMDESAPAVPPSLQNIEDVQAVPVMLAVFFGGLVLLALGNGLVIIGHRHRRQFGVVRSLGFTHGQVRATLASMAVTLGAVSLAFGVPLGLGLGVWLWSALSKQLDVATAVSWPLVPVVVMVPLVLVVAVVAAASPARAANAERAAEILRAE